jgi:voltage-gated potassium channel Kch
MSKPSLNQRFRYWFDNLMSRGTVALIGGLALASLLLVFIAGFIITIGGKLLAPAGEEPQNIIEAIWKSLMRTLDPGTMGGDEGWGFRITMLLVTIGGIFIVSSLIGVITSGLEAQLEHLRKGRSLVLESGHTVILGWSPQIFTVISELVVSNENRKKGAVVAILANQDKVEMEDAIRERIPDTKNTKVICRSGSPIDLNDLEIVSPHLARSIIVLPPDDNDPDSHVVKTVLAITNNPNRRKEPYHIVTQIQEQTTLDVLKMVGQEDIVQPVITGDLIARLTAQTSRLSGLSVAYTELMNFGGDEIYFKEEAGLVGKPFGDAILAYEDSAVLGLRFANGNVSLNPPMDTVISAGDAIIALSADDDTIQLTGLPAIPLDTSAMKHVGEALKPKPESVLILGWNRCGAVIIRELDNYVTKGSRVHVVADPEVSEEVTRVDRILKECCNKLANQKITFQEGDTTNRAVLDSLKIADYDHVIALSYAGLDVQAADAKTLITLLHLRDIAERDETPFSIVSEMLDLRNRELAEVTRVDDFIVSDHLVSLLMTQLSENRDLLAVFTDIFDPEGSEIYLKPVGDYIETGRPVNFYTLAEVARQRGEVAFGYRLVHEAGHAERSYGVHTNPKKSEMVNFAPEDKVIVLAEM